MDVLRHTFTIPSLLLAMACGGSGSGTATPTPQAPTIATQPVSQTTTVGNSTTFTVLANGSEPLSYQWYWNGLPVAGANAATFITPGAVPSDHQSSLLVTVNNAVGSVTSTVATLSVDGSPRPPKAGDLRFKDVDAFPVQLVGGLVTNFDPLTEYSFQNYAGSVIKIGWPGPDVADGNPYNTCWFFSAQPLPLINTMPGRKTTYQADDLGNFQADLSPIPFNTIIASLDMCAVQNVFAWELVQTTATQGFSPRMTGSVIPSGLQTIATQEGLASRVITAVTLNTGQATFISYGWQGDTSTVYEASVETATLDTVGSVAATLAEQGYLITAIGGNDTDGFILVGTRVQGDTTPRQIQFTTPNLIGRGYTLVGYIFVNNLSNPSASKDLYIYEQ